LAANGYVILKRGDRRMIEKKTGKRVKGRVFDEKKIPF